jgi:hypothetical protein
MTPSHQYSPTSHPLLSCTLKSSTLSRSNPISSITPVLSNFLNLSLKYLPSLKEGGFQPLISTSWRIKYPGDGNVPTIKQLRKWMEPVIRLRDASSDEDKYVRLDEVFTLPFSFILSMASCVAVVYTKRKEHLLNCTQPPQRNQM